MKKYLKWILLFLLIVSMNGKLISQIHIDVNASNILATGVSDKYGINLNAGVDHDDNREPGARSLAEAILETGSKRLRYPGGKKSLYFVWTADPSNPDPSTSYWTGYYASKAQTTLNFDEFMALCAETGAEPHVNVAVNPTDTSIFNQKLAAEWVRYANITNNYNVKYWEIGNEMWNDRNYDGHTVDYSKIVEIVNTFSDAMKAVDPTIQVGVSWKKNQAQKLINECGYALDFYVISNYTDAGGKTYSDYVNGTHVDLLKVDNNLSLKTVISEFNRSDWSKSNWDTANNTGKGLINFDLIGQILESPKTEYGCFWNTRWFPDEDGVYSGTKWDALDNQNNLRAVAKPFILWKKFLGDDLVEITSGDGSIVPYATRDGSKLNVILINKATSAQSVTVNLPNSSYNSSEVWQYKGADEWDTDPSIGKVNETSVSNNMIRYELPSTSITVFSLSNGAK